MRLKNLSKDAKARQEELRLLKQMVAADRAAKKKEAAQIAKQKKALAALDIEIESMRKRLGGPAIRVDDSLDTMLAMVRQKETQEKKLENLRRKKEAEARKRKQEIERLKKEREEKIIVFLTGEAKKYKEIVFSKYGQSMKSAAGKSLVAKCPQGWADGVKEGDCDHLVLMIRSGGKIEKIIGNSIGMKFVYIKHGTFLMAGESGRYDDENQHRVTLTRGFYMQTTEVTQGQWKAVMGDNPSGFKNGYNCF